MRACEWLWRRIRSLQAIQTYMDMRTSKEGMGEKVILDLNENYFVPRELMYRLLLEVAEECDPRRYPQHEELELRSAISQYLRVPADCVVLGNGSNQLIHLIVQAFLREGDEAISITPTFSIYQYCVNLQNARYIGIPLKQDFSLDVDQILKAVSEKTKLIFLSSPNNPTANQFKKEDILTVLENFPGLVVIDEAYVEFSDQPSMIAHIHEFENLVVLRSFSKTFGMAGLRLGYAISSEKLAYALRRLLLPFNVNAVTLRMGVKILRRVDLVKATINRLKGERERLIRGLNGIEGVNAFKSQTNFVLFQTKKPSSYIHEKLLERGIATKNLGRILHLENCLRTTVRPPEVNDMLLDTLKELCEEQG